jgi:ribosomal protein S18 acetylase RimI-like enzyme
MTHLPTAADVSDSVATHQDATMIATLDQLAAHALPAEVCSNVDGWLLRYHYGMTRRANSVLPLRQGKLSTSEKLHLVEAFYARANQPARFQVSPACAPHDLPDILSARGYQVDTVTSVQLADTQTVLTRAKAKLFEVWLQKAVTPAWLEHETRFAHPERAQHPAYRSLFENVPTPCTFASLRQENAVIALGLCVFHPTTHQAGLFNIATQTTMRRRGAATTLLYYLAKWADKQGATQLYLQVETQNTSANALYAKLGFETHYSYQHWYKPH